MPILRSELSGYLFGEMKRHDIKSYELEAKLGVSANTLRKWLRHPESATLATLLQIAKYLGISGHELCAVIERSIL